MCNRVNSGFTEQDFIRTKRNSTLLLIILLVMISGCAGFKPVDVEYKHEEETKKVTAQGFGKTQDESLQNAFSNAHYVAFGAKVESEQVVTNRNLVKDTVTLSNAIPDTVIKNYRILRQYKKDGKEITEIEAYVTVTRLIPIASKKERIMREDWNGFIAQPDPVTITLGIVKNIFTAVPKGIHNFLKQEVAQ